MSNSGEDGLALVHLCFEGNKAHFDPEMFNFRRFSAGNCAIFALSVHIFKRQQGGPT